MPSLLWLVPPRSLEFGTRQRFLKPFRMQHCPGELDVNSRWGTLYQARPSCLECRNNSDVINLQYLLRCVVCIVIYFHTSKREETSLGEHGTWIKRIVHEDLSRIINNRKTGPTLAIGWPTTYTGSTTNITKRVANRQHCHPYKRTVVYKLPKCYLTYLANEYQSHYISHINSINYTLPDL